MLEAMAWTLKDQQKVPNIKKWVSYTCIPIYVFISLSLIFFFLISKMFLFIYLFQGGAKGVLFQPASEFLPMIDEVCSVLILMKKKINQNYASKAEFF